MVVPLFKSAASEPRRRSEIDRRISIDLRSVGWVAFLCSLIGTSSLEDSFGGLMVEGGEGAISDHSKATDTQLDSSTPVQYPYQ